MTLRELKQYPSICSEIMEIKTTIHTNTVHGTVRGSDSTFPYLTHAMSISGVPETEENAKILAELRTLEMQKRNIEEFIDGIEDSLTRRIFRLRFIKGWSWVKVAVKTGNNTASSVKMICYRYMNNRKK